MFAGRFGRGAAVATCQKDKAFKRDRASIESGFFAVRGSLKVVDVAIYELRQ